MWPLRTSNGYQTVGEQSHLLTSEFDGRKSSKILKATQSIFLCLLGSFGIAILAGFAVGLSLGIPVTMVIFGYIHVNDCPAERFIPIYLIVGGVFAIFECLVHGYRSCCNKSAPKRQWNEVGSGTGYWAIETVESSTGASCSSKISSLLIVFNILWAIAGCVWIYGAYEPNFKDTTAVDYCDPILYKFAFWLLNSSFIVIGFVIVILSCIGCCHVFFKLKNKSNEATQIRSNHLYYS